MNRVWLGFILALGLFLGLNASALSFQECLRLLQENNAELKSAEWTLKSTEALESGAESGFYPSLSGNLSYGQSKSTTDSFDTTSNGYSASINLSQNVFSGLNDYYKSNQAKANTRVAVATFQIAKAKISTSFISAYQSLLTDLEPVNLAESNFGLRVAAKTKARCCYHKRICNQRNMN